ncbi:MAG TPA: DUF1552 domain-containing protein [Polyangiaceae bacterium]|nr:DUF1552 domain-containing protein [Polyangiaceae bacterium]
MTFRGRGQPGFGRRALLSGLAASLGALPLVGGRQARGQEQNRLRLILWFTPHGTIYDNWKPSGAGSEFELSPILSPLQGHKDKLVILDGLHINPEGVGAPHTKGSPLLWTASPLLTDMTFERTDGEGGFYHGWNSAPSVDQVILQALGSTTPYPSLEFGVRSGGNHPGTRMIYSAAEAPLAPETDPWDAFDRLIGDFGKTEEERALQRVERRSSLDVVASELEALRGKIGSSERHKLDAHLTAVREIEQRLEADPILCAGPMLGDRGDSNVPENTPVVFDRMSELMASSLACGLTDVASMQYRVGENDGGYTYDWLGITSLEHHLMSHEGDSNEAARAELTKIYTWYSERFAYFLDQLAAIPDGDGTLLDNSLVVWGSELGKGNTHDFEHVPFVLAGGAAGKLVTGRYLTYGAVEHNRLLVDICRLMGHDVDTFGHTDVGHGGLKGLVL